MPWGPLTAFPGALRCGRDPGGPQTMGLPLRHSAVESGFHVETVRQAGGTVPSVARAATAPPAKASCPVSRGP